MQKPPAGAERHADRLHRAPAHATTTSRMNRLSIRAVRAIQDTVHGRAAETSASIATRVAAGLRTFSAPDRLLPISVASIVAVASLLAVLPATPQGAVGGTEGSGTSPAPRDQRRRRRAHRHRDGHDHGRRRGRDRLRRRHRSRPGLVPSVRRSRGRSTRRPGPSSRRRSGARARRRDAAHAGTRRRPRSRTAPTYRDLQGQVGRHADRRSRTTSASR